MNTGKALLKIDSSILGNQSVTRTLTDYLTDQLLAENPQLSKIEHDLGEHPLPQLNSNELSAVHGSQQTLDPEIQAKLALSNQLIDELMQTRTLVIGAPMYNFGVPASLKNWIDLVARARVTFRYSEQGPEGLTGIEDAYVVVATGGTPVGSGYDFVSGYLKTVLEFIGVRNVHIIDASGQGSTEKTIAAGKAKIDALTARLAA